MAKRRFHTTPDRETPLEDLSPEERRDRRREERARATRGKKPKEERTGWRRGIVPGAVAASIVVVILVLWFGVGLLFPHPCLAFQAIPSQSGIPNFPNATTTDFAQTWCPTATALFSIHPHLQISINGETVGLPPSIGRSQNFTGHPCNLPLHTQPGLGSGIFNVTSPWPYEYTLGDLFTVWQESYVSAFVNATYSTRTIDYTTTSLLGLPADSGHSLTLYVDNQPSSSGPGLVLNSLNNVAGSSPSCIDSVYGSGHTIALVYATVHAAASLPGPVHPALGTAAGMAERESGVPVPPASVSADSASPAVGGPPTWWILRGPP